MTTEVDTPLPPRLESFCINYVKLNSNGTKAAIAAGYTLKSAPVMASKNLRRVNVIKRITELRQKTEDKTIMQVIERKQRLSEIARGKVTDFMSMDGDEVRCFIEPHSEGAGAVQEVSSRTTRLEGNPDNPIEVVTTKVKMHDPVRAISELNKMEKIYTDGAQINIDNRTLNIIVRNQETADNIARIAERRLPTNADVTTTTELPHDDYPATGVNRTELRNTEELPSGDNNEQSIRRHSESLRRRQTQNPS